MYTVYITPALWFTAKMWLTQNYMMCPADYKYKEVAGSIEVTFTDYNKYDWFFKRWIGG